jgi:nucleoside-triphosphatase
MLFTPNKIYILVCEKHSGKTTALMQWVKDKKNMAGILSPVVNEERMFYNIANGEYFTMLATANEETLLVGKYAFSKTAFDKANTILKEIKNQFVIIDEIGPLELMGKGFADTLKNILQQKNYANLLLVVRNGLVDDMVEYFSIDVNEKQFIGIDDFVKDKI